MATNSKAYARQHYLDNIDLYKSRAKAQRKKLYLQLKRFVEDYKSNNPCTDCGKYYPYCAMDFDHIAEKKHAVARLHRFTSMSGLRAEIAKCELVCANCHRIRTYNRLKAIGG